MLLVSSPGELLESVRFRHYFYDDGEPAWFYLVFAGIFGFFFALYVIGAYVIAQVLRYSL
jgi:hypothetical protein